MGNNFLLYWTLRVIPGNQTNTMRRREALGRVMIWTVKICLEILSRNISVILNPQPNQSSIFLKPCSLTKHMVYGGMYKYINQFLGIKTVTSQKLNFMKRHWKREYFHRYGKYVGIHKKR